MATQITAAPYTATDEAIKRFCKAVDIALAACGRGFRGKVAVSMSDVVGIGGDALGLFKKQIDERALTAFALTADPDADLICIEPGVILASMPGTKDATVKTKRPKNPFVIFRLDHHEQVKAENPGIHNNDISKIVGVMWRNASAEVKAAYKEKAEEEKRQHAIDHPGYKYQPRKPSEKKKRMTKNKLAKLAVQSNSTNATTNATTLPAQQNGQTIISTVDPPHQNNSSQLTTHSGDPSATFDVVQGAFGDDQLPVAPYLGVEDFAVSVLNPTTNEQACMPDIHAEQHRQEELDEYIHWDDFLVPFPQEGGQEGFGLELLAGDD